MGETQSADTHAPVSTFRLRVSTSIARSPECVYRLVSDLERSGDWSPECIGGRWVAGAPGEVGSVFAGENHRSSDVVHWAPVLRGKFHSEMEVIEASPPRTFRWAMRDSAGWPQQSVWGFDISPDTVGTLMIHTFWMGRLTEGMKKIVAGMDEPELDRFLNEWGTKIKFDMARAVARIKDLLESDPGGPR